MNYKQNEKIEQVKDIPGIVQSAMCTIAARPSIPLRRSVLPGLR